MQIKLKLLHLTNFMTYHDKTFTFGDTTKISGKNGVGKSSICTAYSWLLFDTDSELHSNPKIRREINGQPVNDMDAAVEAVFDIDGKEVTARKVQKRTFSKDKASYKDDNTYFINEVPKTLKAFNEYFGVDMKILQMCSNINAFLSKKDKDMREYLFSKVEDITDLDIAKKYEELAELVPLLEQYTTEEIEKMNKTSKSKIEKEIPILEGQIKEKERDVTENADIDVAELELARNGLKEKIADIKAKQADISKQYEEYQKLSDGVLELKFELNGLQQKANLDLEKKRREIRAEIDDVDRQLKEAKHQIGLNRIDVRGAEDAVRRDTTLRGVELDNWQIKKARLSMEEKRLSAEKECTFDSSNFNCPYCGQELPDDKKEEKQAEFESHKAEEISRIEKGIEAIKAEIKAIEERGNELKAAIDKDKAEIEQLKATLKENEDEEINLSESIKELNASLKELPENIDISYTEEYKAIQSKIAEKEAAMQKGNSADEIRQSLNAELSEAEEQLLEVEKQIAKADVSADEERLAELKKQRMDLEQSKTDCEKILDLLSELDKKKNESLSESINALFGIVDWRLYEYNKSGGYKSVCVPMVDEKSILDITSNKGNRILGRLDIINSIQKIEGLQTVVFLDDAESLDDENIAKAVEILGCQAILLQVNNEDELKIEVV